MYLVKRFSFDRFLFRSVMLKKYDVEVTIRLSLKQPVSFKIEQG